MCFWQFYELCLCFNKNPKIDLGSGKGVVTQMRRRKNFRKKGRKTKLFDVEKNDKTVRKYVRLWNTLYKICRFRDETLCHDHVVRKSSIKFLQTPL